MKVMLTPPDLWGSTGYIGESGGQGVGRGTPETLYKERSGDGEERENMILLNRQRQVKTTITNSFSSLETFKNKVFLCH